MYLFILFIYFIYLFILFIYFDLIWFDLLVIYRGKLYRKDPTQTYIWDRKVK